MKTCKYCATELEYIGRLENENQFFCTFCDLAFPEYETCLDRKRKKFKPQYVDENNISLTVKEMLEMDTINLFYALRATNKFWYSVKGGLEFFKKGIKLQKFSPAEAAAFNEMKNEYNQITKQKFALENIILERTGFLPEKITDEFLLNLVNTGAQFDEKPMYIYIK